MPWKKFVKGVREMHQRAKDLGGERLQSFPFLPMLSVCVEHLANFPSFGSLENKGLLVKKEKKRYMLNPRATSCPNERERKERKRVAKVKPCPSLSHSLFPRNNKGL